MRPSYSDRAHDGVRCQGGGATFAFVVQRMGHSNRSSTFVRVRVHVRHPSCMADARRQTGGERLHDIMMYRLARAKIRAAVVMCGVCALGGPGCTDDDENAACSWLSAPTSFVEAPMAPGCTAEPAGHRCNPANGLCTDICPAGQYRLTCLETEAPRFSNPEDTVRDPITGGRMASWTAVPTDGGAISTRAEYCCQC